MRRLIDVILFVIILLTPVLRILNGYVGIIGDLAQMLFLILFLLRFFTGSNPVLMYIINIFMLMLIVLNAGLLGFTPDYIKLYIFCAIFTLSLDHEFVKDFKDFILDHKVLILTVFAGVSAVLLLFLMRTSSFYNMYGVLYFKGNMNHPHTMGYTCAFIILATVVLAELYKSRLVLLLALVPLYCINLTGVRTVVVALLIGLVIYLVKKIRSFGQFMLFVCGIAASLAMIVTFMSANPIVEKFLLTDDDISSGRFTFWLIDIMAWVKLPLLHKLFGNSFLYLYKVNYLYFRLPIGAHNDFISMLVGTGVIGLTLYMIILIVYGVHVRLEYIAIFVILAGLNGLFGYSELVYVMPMLSILGTNTKWRFKFTFGERHMLEVTNENYGIG